MKSKITSAEQNKALSGVYQNLADRLFEIGCIKFGAFRLKLHETNPNAPLSPIYINLRLLQSFPEIMKEAVLALSELVKDIKFDVIAAIPIAATPLGTTLSLHLNIPLITPRPPKTHGLGGGLDGVFEANQTALLLDDLVTKADSKLEAIKTLKEKGINVKELAVLIDRQQGGKEELKKYGINLNSVFTLSQLLDYYHKSGKINDELYGRTLTYLSNNS